MRSRARNASASGKACAATNSGRFFSASSCSGGAIRTTDDTTDQCTPDFAQLGRPRRRRLVCFDGSMNPQPVDEPPHVLLVEDDRDTREMYSQYLSYSGLTVSEASTGRGGLERILAEHPDVVVTDIAMPEMD